MRKTIFLLCVLHTLLALSTASVVPGGDSVNHDIHSYDSVDPWTRYDMNTNESGNYAKSLSSSVRGNMKQQGEEKGHYSNKGMAKTTGKGKDKNKGKDKDEDKGTRKSNIGKGKGIDKSKDKKEGKGKGKDKEKGGGKDKNKGDNGKRKNVDKDIGKGVVKGKDKNKEKGKGKDKEKGLDKSKGMGKSKDSSKGEGTGKGKGKDEGKAIGKGTGSDGGQGKDKSKGKSGGGGTGPKGTGKGEGKNKGKNAQREQDYPPECKCREVPAKPGKESVCYDMVVPMQPYGRCTKRGCNKKYECVPSGGSDLPDCLRRIARYETKLQLDYKGLLLCNCKELKKPKVFYTLY